MVLKSLVLGENVTINVLGQISGSTNLGLSDSAINSSNNFSSSLYGKKIDAEAIITQNEYTGITNSFDNNTWYFNKESD